MKYCIRYNNNDFCFVFNEETNINENTDIEICDDIYERYKKEQSKGKKYRIKDIHGSTFEEIFEEYEEDAIEIPYKATLEERNRADIDYIALMLGVEL